MIAILDYGVGNLHSVAKAFAADGFEAEVTAEPSRLDAAAGVVLPGDGAFGAVSNHLRESGLERPILRAIGAGKPFLGICIGYQILFDSSEESPGVPGLGVIPGTVRRLEAGSGRKVPHMGWNTLERVADVPFLRDVHDGDMVYFVHSYYPCPDDSTTGAAWTDYGAVFPSVYCRDNVIATQFHPEKSGSVGRAMVRAFGRICQRG